MRTALDLLCCDDTGINVYVSVRVTNVQYCSSQGDVNVRKMLCAPDARQDSFYFAMLSGLSAQHAALWHPMTQCGGGEFLKLLRAAVVFSRECAAELQRLDV